MTEPKTEIERLARVLCEADPTAPDPDAPIYSGMQARKAWEARVPLIRAVLEASPASINIEAMREAIFEMMGDVGQPVTDEFAVELGTDFLRNYAQAILNEKEEEG